MKKLLFVLTLLFLSLSFVNPIFAGNDLTVTCTQDNKCQKSSNLPIFSESNISPGFFVSQKFKVINLRNDNCDLSFYVINKDTQENIFPNKISISITNESSVLYAGNLQTLYTQPVRPLGQVKSNSEANYIWSASFDQSAGNEYQNLITRFDSNINFLCNSTAPSIILNSIPTSTSIGNSFPLVFSIKNAQPNTKYYYKIYGGIGSNYDLLTYNGTNYLNLNSSWDSFPFITTDAKGDVQPISGFARSKDNGPTGIYDLWIKLAKSDDTSKSLTSELHAITINPLGQNIKESSINSSPPDNSVCNDGIPIGAPKLLNITPGTNSVTLHWSEDSKPLTYYLIAFGTSPGVYQYGNPNIGGPGTTSYTVNNLSADKTYYFTVRAGNGCKPGSFSNELSAKPLGVNLTNNNPPPGFKENVLGASTESTNPSETKQTGNVLGESSNNWSKIIFYLSLILFFSISYSIFKSFKKKTKTR